MNVTHGEAHELNTALFAYIPVAEMLLPPEAFAAYRVAAQEASQIIHRFDTLPDPQTTIYVGLSLSMVREAIDFQAIALRAELETPTREYFASPHEMVAGKVNLLQTRMGRVTSLSAKVALLDDNPTT